MQSRILVVEDDPKIAKVIRVYLENAGFKVDHVMQGKEAIRSASESAPLLVILDLMLPDISGEAVCRALREMGDFPIIMLTSKSSEEERVTGFALGADDYVVKPFSAKELVYRVQAVLKRAQKKEADTLKPLSFNNGLLIIDGQGYRVTKKRRNANLTPTEFKILYTLASYPGKVFTREELVEKALGYKFEGYERSVDAHIKNIRQKIEEDVKNPGFIITIYGVGYRFSGAIDA